MTGRDGAIDGPRVRLTVGIPTFDRPDRLAATVRRLLPQLGADDELLVLDNASPRAAAEVLAPSLQAYPSLRVRVMRHRVNIGGAANILRVMEEADPDTWLWLLGDDDDIATDAIDGIRETIRANADAVFINFTADNHVRADNLTTRGVSEFIAGIDSWSNLNFMSVDVFRVARIQQVLRRGYHFAFSMSPHIAVVLAALGDDGLAIFSRRCIIERHDNGGWAPTLVFVGRPTLLDFPFSPRDRAVLAARLRRETDLEYLTTYLVGEARRTGDVPSALHLLDQVRGRLYGPGTAMSSRLRLGLYRWLVRFPDLGQALIKAALALRARLRGKAAPDQASWVSGSDNLRY